jgi:hypothetical protein
MSNLWLNIVTSGTAANRPTSPPSDLPIAFYYATDTATLYFWSGAAWASVGSQAPTPATPNYYSWEAGAGAWVQSAQAYATQGIGILPLANFTVDRIYAGLIAPTAAHTYRAAIYAVNATWVIQSIVGQATAVTPDTATRTLTFTFATPMALVAGTNYIIAITDTNATLVTTSCMIGGSSSDTQPRMFNLPVDTVQTTLNLDRFGLASKGPIVGDTFTAIGAGGALIGVRAQF